MKILLLCPQPFYQVRGTPISNDLILRTLSERGDCIDVVTYHEGHNVKYDGVVLHRILNIPFIRRIRPGFSWKKIICDILMCLKMIQLLAYTRYHVIHAVEESVFLALIAKKLCGIPYVYDMDSSLVQQMVEKYSILVPFTSVLNFFERSAVSNAKVTLPVCDALATRIARYKPEKVVTIHDVPLLEGNNYQNHVDLRNELGIQGCLFLYIGNLEAYQGIDLLLESFALVLKKTAQADLLIIGGEALDRQKYQRKSRDLGIDRKVHFLGPTPVQFLATILSQADVLVSPRTKGENTPMKLYSYLHSQKAVLATNLPTHMQVLNDRVAMLVDPTPESFSEGMFRLIKDSHLRSTLGMAGKMLVEENYNYNTFRYKLNGLYDWLAVAIGQSKDTIVNNVKSTLISICVHSVLLL
jgi:glycosyltransferase involved in cell wall biosynthesis